MARIAIIGSGNLGANTAFFIAEKAVADCILYDIKEGLATGKALDLMEAAPLRRYHTWIHAAKSFDEVRTADFTIIAAGNPRKPGQTREDLFLENAPLIADYARKLGNQTGMAGRFNGPRTQSGSGSILIVTEPVDALTTLFVRLSGWEAHRVLGMGTVLDSYRLRYLIAARLGIISDDVQVTVLGRHGSDVLLDFARCSVAGIGIEHLLSAADLADIRNELVGSGDAIIKLAGRNSSYYAPSVAAADIAEAVVRNTGGIFSVSHIQTSPPSLPDLGDIALSMPAVLGKNGIEQTMRPVLGPEAQKVLSGSAGSIRTLVDEWMGREEAQGVGV